MNILLVAKCVIIGIVRAIAAPCNNIHKTKNGSTLTSRQAAKKPIFLTVDIEVNDLAESGADAVARLTQKVAFVFLRCPGDHQRAVFHYAQPLAPVSDFSVIPWLLTCGNKIYSAFSPRAIWNKERKFDRERKREMLCQKGLFSHKRKQSYKLFITKKPHSASVPQEALIPRAREFFAALRKKQTRIPVGNLLSTAHKATFPFRSRRVH